MSCTTDKIAATLQALSYPPKLIITDSQVFHTVYEQKPAESLLTSFSVLMAGYKGDILYYMEGASAIDRLTPQSRVLIAEACTHAPATEDIGRVKLPRMLRKKIGEELQNRYRCRYRLSGGFDTLSLNHSLRSLHVQSQICTKPD